MQHDTHCAAGTFRSEAHRCWKNATAMYCRASTRRDADTRLLYIQLAVCWAALAAELEQRLSLAYKDSASRDDAAIGDRWPPASGEAPALAAADPSAGS